MHSLARSFAATGRVPRAAAALLVGVLLAAVAVAPSVPARAASLTQVTNFGSNPGNLLMFRYVPAGLPANAPLVVALHGCTQSASSYDDEPGWTVLADRWKFVLVLPQQQTSNNSSQCFDWFQSGDITRGQGEALSVKQMVDETKSEYSIAPGRVFVTGLSAGGAFTAVMLATYPDVFSAGAIVAGIPYGCATTVSAAYGCMSPGVDLAPQQWGDKVRAASSWTGPWPRVSLWQGTSDTTVAPMNMTELMQQWTDVAGADQTPDVQDTVKGYPHKVYRDASGRAAVETYSITGMGHGTPIDPGTATDQCGTPAAYILDANICSSYFIGQWFGLDNADHTAPTVSLTAPTNGATVSGTVTMTASASDDVGVARVEFLVDGAVVATDTAAPWSAAWNSSAATNGGHTLAARAYDAAGNAATSAGVGVTVTGGQAAGLTEHFSDRDGNGDYYDSPGWSTTSWSAVTVDHTGTAGSESAYGYASSGAGCATGTVRQVLSRSVTLGSAPTLSYARQLALYAAVNTSTTASFRVTVNGTVVDSRSVTYGNYAESGWNVRSGIDLSAYAGRTVTLAFEVTAYSNVCVEVSSQAWVDDVVVSG